MWNFIRHNPTLLACLIVIPLAFMLSRCDSAVSEHAPLPVSVFDERLEQIEREALDEAYRGQIMHVFEVWMKDATGQPARALTGARNARRAYVDAMTEIEKRSQKNRVPR